MRAACLPVQVRRQAGSTRSRDCVCECVGVTELGCAFHLLPLPLFTFPLGLGRVVVTVRLWHGWHEGRERGVHRCMRGRSPRGSASPRPPGGLVAGTPRKFLAVARAGRAQQRQRRPRFRPPAGRRCFSRHARGRARCGSADHFSGVVSSRRRVAVEQPPPPDPNKDVLVVLLSLLFHYRADPLCPN